MLEISLHVLCIDLFMHCSINIGTYHLVKGDGLIVTKYICLLPSFRWILLQIIVRHLALILEFQIQLMSE